ncbi:hypothetical protein [Bacillus thuringiensis]|uniref:hypothetical protein n=1 Tax=Bacillus thuringiensis TaxID=1428 RepID=UPI000A3A9176|nr:hypothetical protein [Bacillus thuringiensis]OUA87629.1 hypothetical protein BK706_18445 [Bacillus thuringiensis serovar leesis]
MSNIFSKIIGIQPARPICESAKKVIYCGNQNLVMQVMVKVHVQHMKCMLILMIQVLIALLHVNNFVVVDNLKNLKNNRGWKIPAPIIFQ